ncbi:hypothetical protein JCM8097_001402 [Rhodosporidiobolus ruineniae]
MAAPLSPTAAPSLLDFLSSSLSSAPLPGKHSYHLAVTRSAPQRSHALFPHASNARTAKVYHQEVLVVLSERRQVPTDNGGGEAGKDATDAPNDAAREAEPGQAAAGSLSSNAGAPVEEGKDVLPLSAAAGGASAAATSGEGAATTTISKGEKHEAHIPIVAIEATLCTIPSSSSALVYVSKVDTTGLTPPSPSSPSSAQPAPTRLLVASFLAFHLLHPPSGAERVRIHIFARSQGQYLFPGSVENATKRVLDDKGLLRWWKGTVERAVKRVEEEKARAAAPPQPASETAAPATSILPAPTPEATAVQQAGLRLFYLIPGLTHLESLPYVPPSPLPGLVTPWTYTHPYASLSSPLHPAHVPPAHVPLTDHLPAFPDDPKARFLSSLTSSTVSPSGTPGDWDDVHLALSSSTFTTGQAPGAKRAAVEADLERERKRLVEGVPGGVEEWWERMAFRQECCSGQLVGFFVVAAGEPSPSSSTSSSASAVALPPAPPSPAKSSSARDSRDAREARDAKGEYPLALPPSLFTKLWSAFHNQDYALPSLSKLTGAVERWRGDVERVARVEYDERAEGRREGEGEGEFEKTWREEGMRVLEVEGPEVVAAGEGGGVKRPAPVEEKKVNVLAPRKRKKPAPPTA